MSPVIGLTTKRAPAFPELGTLRKGAPKPTDPNDKRPGKDLTFFRFASERPEVLTAFLRHYKEEPTQLTVYLPFPAVEENFTAWKEEWGASGLIQRCDGQTIIQRYDKATGKQVFGEWKCQQPKCQCRLVGRLRIFLPDLLQDGLIGFVTVLTSSIHDIISIQSSLEAALAVSPAGLSGIPFVLWRQPTSISTPDPKSKSGRARRVKSLIKIAPAGQWVQRMLAASERHNLAVLEGEVSALPAPRVKNVETGEIEDDEQESAPEDVEEGGFTDSEGPADLFPDADALPEAGEPEAELEPKPDLQSAAKVTATGLLADARKRVEAVLTANRKAINDEFRRWFKARYQGVEWDNAKLDLLNQCEQDLKELLAKPRGVKDADAS